MNNDDYIHRKSKEVQFLLKVACYFDFLPNEIANINSKFEVLEQKNTLRAAIKCGNICKNKDVLNTNIFSVNKINNWLYTKYSYRRYSAYISDKDYKEYSGEFKFFINCGMSALASLFFATRDLGYSVAFDKVYFETVKMIKENRRGLCFRKIHFYDSLEERIDVERLDPRYSLIDTTCLSLNEERLLIKQLHNKKANAVLVRSNVKLDMLGIDYSNIGTVIYLTPNSHFSSFFEKLLNAQIKWLGRFGSFPDPCDVPAFWMTQFYPEFELLNDRRLQICKYNNAYAYSYLNRLGFLKLDLKWHGFFLLICCSENVRKRYDDKFEVFKKECESKDIPVYNNGSFGADVTLIDTYQDWISKDYYIRISFTDLELIDVEIILDLFVKYFITD